MIECQKRRYALERRVSQNKTEYKCVNERETSVTVKLQGAEVMKVDEFTYLRSTVERVKTSVRGDL